LGFAQLEYYSPIGFEGVYDLKSAWKIGGTLEYGPFWSGEQESHLGDATPGLGILSNDQDDGWGMRFSLFLKREWEIFQS